MTDSSKPSLIVRIPTALWLIVLGIAFSGWARLTFKRQNAEIYPWSEERSMEHTFGDAFRAYRARVRRWI